MPHLYRNLDSGSCWAIKRNPLRINNGILATRCTCKPGWLNKMLLGCMSSLQLPVGLPQDKDIRRSSSNLRLGQTHLPRSLDISYAPQFLVEYFRDGLLQSSPLTKPYPSYNPKTLAALSGAAYYKFAPWSACWGRARNGNGAHV